LNTAYKLANRDWESIFTNWAKPPSQSEEDRCENALSSIRNAINRSEKLNKRNIKIFSQGSYRNNVNVRQDSDVDVGVICFDTFFTTYPSGMGDSDFGNIPSSYTYKQFKNELEEALVSYFGRTAVTRGNKAFDIKENSYHVEADVVPLCEIRTYNQNKGYFCGVALLPDNGARIENYPEKLSQEWPDIPLHYENGVQKNTATGRSYKGAVRIIKKLRNEMADKGIACASPIPGFLVECLVWNAADRCFSADTWEDKIQGILCDLWSKTKEEAQCKEWCEVNNIKYLFHPSQKWTREQAHTFIDSAWDYVGIKS
jgi:hypothetical protein